MERTSSVVSIHQRDHSESYALKKIAEESNQMGLQGWFFEDLDAHDDGEYIVYNLHFVMTSEEDEDAMEDAFNNGNGLQNNDGTFTNLPDPDWGDGTDN